MYIVNQLTNFTDSHLSSWRYIRQKRAFGVSVIEFSSLLIDEDSNEPPNIFVDKNGAMDRKEKNHVYYPLTPSEAVARFVDSDNTCWLLFNY